MTSNPSSALPTAKPRPNFSYYGWRISGALSITTLFSYGILFHYEWREALRILAFVLGIVTIPLHALVIRRDPSDRGLLVDGDSAVTSNTERQTVETSVSASVAQGTATFWRIAVAFGLARFLATVISAHLVPLLLEAGREKRYAALVAGSVGPLQVFGRVVFFPLSRRLSSRSLNTATFAMFVIAFAALRASTIGLAVIAFVILYGAANGAVTMNRAFNVAEQFGPAAYGRISGTITMVGSLMAVCAPFSAGYLRTESATTGSCFSALQRSLRSGHSSSTACEVSKSLLCYRRRSCSRHSADQEGSSCGTITNDLSRSMRRKRGP